MTDPAERLRQTLREDGWAEGSYAMGQLDEALAKARAAGAAEERERIRVAVHAEMPVHLKQTRKPNALDDCLYRGDVLVILDAPAEES